MCSIQMPFYYLASSPPQPGGYTMHLLKGIDWTTRNTQLLQLFYTSYIITMIREASQASTIITELSITVHMKG